MDLLRELTGTTRILPLTVYMSCSTGPSPTEPAFPDPPAGIPAPTIVAYQEFYGSFGPSTYFLFGNRASAGAPVVLDELLDDGLAVKLAWYPHGDGGCMGVMLAQMVVELRAPDERMLEHGFTTSSQALAPGPCIPTWLQYSFERQKLPADGSG